MLTREGCRLERADKRPTGRVLIWWRVEGKVGIITRCGREPVRFSRWRGCTLVAGHDEVR